MPAFLAVSAFIRTKMSRKQRKTLIIKKVNEPIPAPESPRIAEPTNKTWKHPDNLFRFTSLTITGTGLIVSILLSKDQLFTSKEERQAMQREAIRLELVERERVEKELQRQEQLENERLEKERLAKEKLEQQRLAEERERQRLEAEKKTVAEGKRPTRKKRGKDPIGKFFRKVFS